MRVLKMSTVIKQIREGRIEAMQDAKFGYIDVRAAIERERARKHYSLGEAWRTYWPGKA